MVKLLRISIAAALLLCATFAFGQGFGGPGMPGGPQGFGGMGPGGMGPGGMGPMGMRNPGIDPGALMQILPPPAFALDRMSAELGLTKEQSDKLQAVATKGDKAVHARIQKLMSATRKLHAALNSSTFNAETVKSAAKEVQIAQNAVVNAAVDEWIDIRGVLNADQMGRLQEMLSRPHPMGMTQRGFRRGFSGPNGFGPAPGGPMGPGRGGPMGPWQGGQGPQWQGPQGRPSNLAPAPAAPNGNPTTPPPGE
jgi:Spy/CpxP family protein refolding chaperone